MSTKKKAGLPRDRETWAVRGVDAETRTAVKMAARRSGLTVGEWCNKVLREAATERMKQTPPAPQLEDTLAKLAESLDRQARAQQEQTEAINARISAIEARTGASGASGSQTPGNLLARLYGLLKPS